MGSDLRERAEAHAGLCRVYGNAHTDATWHELWAGCKDAAPLLEELLAALAAERAAGFEEAREAILRVGISTAGEWDGIAARKGRATDDAMEAITRASTYREFCRWIRENLAPKEGGSETLE